MPSSGGAFPTDPDVFVEWLNEILSADAYADSYNKLQGLDADEKHLFFMTGSRTSFVHDMAAHKLSPIFLPATSPDVPSWISHFWGTSRWGPSGAALWIREVGWSFVRMPEVDLGYEG
jgi:hypothetical protein